MTAAEDASFRQSVALSVKCKEQQLSGRACALPAEVVEPACSGDAPSLILDLLFGSAPTSGFNLSSAAGKCQQAIQRGALAYVQKRGPEKIRGKREARRGSVVRTILKRCRGVETELAPGGTIPSVGGYCGHLNTGGNLDAPLLAECIPAALEKILDANLGSEPTRPNIILVITDDQRPETLETMPSVQSLLMRRGTVFRNGFVTTSSCCPSRVSMYTGLYAHNHGILTNAHILLPNDFDVDDTVGKWIQDVGYKTGFFGKFVQYGTSYEGVRPQGWNEWHQFLTPEYYGYAINENGETRQYGSAPSDYSTDLLKLRVVDFIRANRSEPFFVVYAPYAPHWPSTAAPRHQGITVALDPWVRPNYLYPDLTGKPTWVSGVRYLAGNPVTFAAIVEDGRQKQHQSLIAVDEAIKAFDEVLDRHGLTDNTMVVYVSDNGHHWGEHWWFGKFSSYEESIRIPYVVRYPREFLVPAESDALVLNLDLTPTLVEVAQATPSHSMNGQSLVPVLGRATAGRDRFLIENPTGVVVTPSYGVRTRAWKFIRNAVEGEDELYHLEEDPYEMTNLAEDPGSAAIKLELMEALEQMLQE